MTSSQPHRPDQHDTTAADAAAMLDRIVESHRFRNEVRSRRLERGLTANRPADVKRVLERIVALVDRLTIEVETLRKAPVLHYDIDDLAEAFERGGKPALRQAVAECEDSQRQLEVHLTEIQALLPKPPRIRTHLIWLAAATGMLVGMATGTWLHF